MSKIGDGITGFRTQFEADIKAAWSPAETPTIIWNDPELPQTTLPHFICDLPEIPMGKGDGRGVQNVQQDFNASVLGRWKKAEDVDVLAFQTARADELIVLLTPAGGTVYAGLFDSPMVTGVQFNVSDEDEEELTIEVRVSFSCARDVPQLED